MRRLLVALVVLALLAVAGVVSDRRLRSLTEQRVGEQIRLSENLDRTPAVEIGDSPFLAAAWRGRFERVTVRAETFDAGTVPGLPASVGDVRVHDVVATMTDVEAPVRELVAGSTPPITVGRLRLVATMDYPVLSALVAAQADRVTARVGGRIGDLRVTAGPNDDLLVRGIYRAAGLSLDLALPIRVWVEGRDLVFEVATSSDSGGLAAAAAQLINGRFTVPPLAYGLMVDQVQPDADGLKLVAGGENVLIDT